MCRYAVLRKKNTFFKTSSIEFFFVTYHIMSSTMVKVCLFLLYDLFQSKKISSVFVCAFSVLHQPEQASKLEVLVLPHVEPPSWNNKQNQCGERVSTTLDKYIHTHSMRICCKLGEIKTTVKPLFCQVVSHQTLKSV